MRVNARIGISVQSIRVSLILTISLLIRFSSSAQNAIIKASFIPNSFTTYLSSGGQINFKNNSVNSDSYSWDFGDGSALSSEKHPVYRYRAPGIFNVKLKTKNKFGTDSMDILIVVVDDKGSTGSIRNEKKENKIGFTFNSFTETYCLNFNFDKMKDVSVSVREIHQGPVHEETFRAVLSTDIPIDFAHLASGTYIVMVRTQDHVKRSFKVIK